jgi:hypothetical protein
METYRLSIFDIAIVTDGKVGERIAPLLKDGKAFRAASA